MRATEPNRLTPVMLRDHESVHPVFRSRETFMYTTRQKMTPAQLAALVDEALRTHHPLSFLDSAVVTFKTIGRHEDGTAAAWIRCLYAEGEIEAIMCLRTA